MIIEIIGFFILLIGSIHTNQKISEEKGASVKSDITPPALAPQTPAPTQQSPAIYAENPSTETSGQVQTEQTLPQNDIEEQRI